VFKARALFISMLGLSSLQAVIQVSFVLYASSTGSSLVAACGEGSVARTVLHRTNCRQPHVGVHAWQVY
jgi:hypothetical protein